jgi:hypothetical protein
MDRASSFFFRPSTSLLPTIDSTGRSPSHPKSPERLSSPGLPLPLRQPLPTW